MEHDEMIQYALKILHNCNFPDLVRTIANHRCGNEGYHTAEQLFWGVIHERELKDPRTGEKGLKAPIEERMAVIEDVLEHVKNSLCVLTTSVRYEEALATHRRIENAGIELTGFNTRSNTSNRLEVIEDKLDLILEMLLVLTAEDCGNEVQAARALLKSEGYDLKNLPPPDDEEDEPDEGE